MKFLIACLSSKGGEGDGGRIRESLVFGRSAGFQTGLERVGGWTGCNLSTRSAGLETGVPPGTREGTRETATRGQRQTPERVLHRSEFQRRVLPMRENRLPLSVLVADDSSVIRERLVALLNEVPGVSVVGETVCVSGTMEAVRRLRPAVVVLDLSMPGGSGLDVLRCMKEEQLGAMVIVLTNYSFPEYEKEASRYGAAAFLNKSTQFMKVADMVRGLAEQARATAAADGKPDGTATPTNPSYTPTAASSALPGEADPLALPTGTE